MNRPIFLLAPMDDVTDTVFRQIVNSCSKPDLAMTEFVNVDGLVSQGRNKLLKKLKADKSEDNLIAQIWGKDPKNFFAIAKQIADGVVAKEFSLPSSFKYRGVDLNMGCPQKHEVNSGTCSALMNNRELAKDIIDACKKGLNGKLPLSVKTRIGFNDVDLTWIEFLLKQNLNMLTIHGRTKKEKSKTPVHWDVINESRKLRDKLSPNTLIIGNGDIKDKKDGLDKIKKYKLDGVMIGRGIFDDPYLFSDNSPWPDYTKQQRIDLLIKHLNLYKDTWDESEYNLPALNKYIKIYVNGFDGAKELRVKIMGLKNIQDKISSIANFKLL